MAANLGAPPNFEELAQATHTVADNFGRFANLPAVDGGAAILHAIQGLQQQIQQMQQQMQQMQQQMEQMQQQIAGVEQRLGTRISASNTNVLSRLHNSKIITPDQRLMPLYHFATNTYINGFPATSAAIATLPQPLVNDLLAALGEDAEGNIAAKRQRIRRAIGLPEIAA